MYTHTQHESGVVTPGGGVAHRGRLLEGDADAAACGVFDGLFGRVVRRVVDEVAFETASEKDGMGTVRESVCQWALTQTAKTSGWLRTPTR